jgi:GNAT superfamily N-acetyltransferase
VDWASRPAWESSETTLIESLLGDRDRKTWVAERAGSLSGFVVVKRDGATGLADIDLVAVAPGEQRSGIGSRLVEVSLDWLLRASVHPRLLGSRPGTQPAQRAGFVSRKVQPTLYYTTLATPEERVAPTRSIRLSTATTCSSGWSPIGSKRKPTTSGRRSRERTPRRGSSRQRVAPPASLS